MKNEKTTYFLMTGAMGIVTPARIVSYKNDPKVLEFAELSTAIESCKSIARVQMRQGGWLGVYENWGKMEKRFACNADGESKTYPVVR